MDPGGPLATNCCSERLPAGTLEKIHQLAKQRTEINLLITMTFFFPPPLQRRIAYCKMFLALVEFSERRQKFVATRLVWTTLMKDGGMKAGFLKMLL